MTIDEVRDKMTRHDTLEDSTLVCRCGSSFKWSDISGGLKLFLERHTKCYEEKVTESVR